MTRLLLRVRGAATRVGLSTAIVLAVAGCALFEEPRSYRARPGTSALHTSSIKHARPRAAKARSKSKPKVAVARRQKTPIAVPKAPPPTEPKQLSQEAACVSIDQCASVLKAMVDDPDRAWVNWPASAKTLANGVRLFAYRSLRPELTCPEITTALHELTIAQAAFSGPVSGLEQAQIDRARELAAQVESELKTERASRCRNATGQALDIRQGALPVVVPQVRPAVQVR